MKPICVVSPLDRRRSLAEERIAAAYEAGGVETALSKAFAGSPLTSQEGRALIGYVQLLAEEREVGWAEAEHLDGLHERIRSALVSRAEVEA